MEITWIIVISVCSFKGSQRKSDTVILLQTEVVSSMKALFRLVDVSQLSSHFDGSLTLSQCDWMELHHVRQSNHGKTASLSCSPLLNIYSFPHFTL